MKKLGVDMHDQFGELKPTEQIILELADAFNSCLKALQRSAASFEIFKRMGPEAIPC
jgi:hypothetical protein